MRLPLEDVRIIDFTWVLAGPHGTKLLADLGAEVIKIESRTKLDGWRIGMNLLREGVKSPLDEGSGIFQQENRNKKGLSLNLKTKKGRDIFEELVKISDVVACNYSADGFQKMGLQWENLCRINPQIIVVNAPGLGNSGPNSTFITFAAILQAMTGMTSIIGYPGQEPVGVGVPWIDYIGGVSMALGILAALLYRRRKGKGQFIDLSQQEASLSLLGDTLLDWESNRIMRENYGNRHPASKAAPHNCYKCKGEDRWCVISVASEREWECFCNVIGKAHLKDDPKLKTLADRIKNQDYLDNLIESWTINLTPEEATTMLQNGGVSAGVVKNIEDILNDPHLREREFLLEYTFPDSEIKPSSIVIPGIIPKFSRYNLKIRRPAPARLGEDNDAILKDLLNMDQEEIDQAKRDGAFD